MGKGDIHSWQDFIGLKNCLMSRHSSLQLSKKCKWKPLCAAWQKPWFQVAWVSPQKGSSNGHSLAFPTAQLETPLPNKCVISIRHPFYSSSQLCQLCNCALSFIHRHAMYKIIQKVQQTSCKFGPEVIGLICTPDLSQLQRQHEISIEQMVYCIFNTWAV